MAGFSRDKLRHRSGYFREPWSGAAWAAAWHVAEGFLKFGVALDAATVLQRHLGT